MSIDYTLAQQLKDAGFEQKDWGAYLLPGGMEVGPNANAAYVPTLSELIEACGERFNSMGGDVRTNEWWAAERPEGLFVETFPLRCTGKSPTEAVARLWLALNRKA